MQSIDNVVNGIVVQIILSLIEKYVSKCVSCEGLYVSNFRLSKL